MENSTGNYFDACLLMVTGLFGAFAELSLEEEIRAVYYIIASISGVVFLAHKIWTWIKEVKE